MTDSIPNRLIAAIGGHLGPSYSVELSHGKLHYVIWKGGDTLPVEVDIVPTAGQWREFRAALDSIDIWQWRDNYAPELSIRDGTQWNLDVAYEDAALRSGGDNAYPKDESDGGTIPHAAPSARFEHLLKAVSALIGGQDFE
jgi:hypothetical protein